MKVTELVKRHKTANPFIIAEYENIEVRFVSLPSDLKGLMLSTPNDKPMIWINDNIRDCNLRYLVMAHELGHAVLHYNTSTPHLLSMKYRYTSKIESEADEFATILTDLYLKESMEMY